VGGLFARQAVCRALLCTALAIPVSCVVQDDMWVVVWVGCAGGCLGELELQAFQRGVVAGCLWLGWLRLGLPACHCLTPSVLQRHASGWLACCFSTALTTLWWLSSF